VGGLELPGVALSANFFFLAKAESVTKENDERKRDVVVMTSADDFPPLSGIPVSWLCWVLLQSWRKLENCLVVS